MSDAALRRWLPAVIVGITAAGAPVGTAAASTGSDSFRTPAPIAFTNPGTVANTAAPGGSYTVEDSEPTDACGSGSISRTAWWTVTGTGTPLTLTTAGSTFDTVLAVYGAAPGGIPAAFDRPACNDDVEAGSPTSKVTFTATRGRQYLVQVGGKGFASGKITLAASAPRPANDDRAAAVDLSTGQRLDVNTTGAGQEPGETLACGATPYAATVWFAWTAPAIGDATFLASAASNTAVAIYPAAGGPAIACKTGPLASIPLRVAAGDYLIQAGVAGADNASLGVGPLQMRVDFFVDPDVDGDGELKSTDCDDNDPKRRHGNAEVFDDGIDQDCDGSDAKDPDRDRDGEATPGDCNDNDAAIHHGAPDLPGNTVDEDCAGGPAPFPRIESIVRTGWRLQPFRLTELALVRAVPSRVEITCKGKGCPYKKQVVKVKKEQATRSILDRRLKKARLGKGAVLEVRITLDDHVGFLRRMTVGAATKQPKLSDLCLPVGGAKPTKC